MKREEKINKHLACLLPDIFLDTCETIERYHEKNSQVIIKELTDSLKAAAGLAFESQKDKGKGRIKYLLFSHLHSGLRLGWKRIRIDLLDRRFYLDRTGSASYLELSGIYRFFDEDIQRIKKELIRQVPRLYEYELDHIRYVYGGYYHRIAGQFLKDILEGESFEALFSGVEAESGVKLLFGEYMGPACLLGAMEGGKRDEVFPDICR